MAPAAAACLAQTTRGFLNDPDWVEKDQRATGDHRELEAALQHPETLWIPRVQAAGREGVRACHVRAGGSATPTSTAARARVESR